MKLLSSLKCALLCTAVSVSGLAASAATSVFEADGTFVVPNQVDTITLLLIGGGGAGAGSHWGGGGGGILAGGTFGVVAGTSYGVTVGQGGAAASCAGNACVGTHGSASSFGNLLTAAGGGAANWPTPWIPGGGNGGSGGGGAGNSGHGGAGGSGGTAGTNGGSYVGGTGQGTSVWTPLLALISELAVTAGAGGSQSAGSHQGGGGGGGILVDGSGPDGDDGIPAFFAAGEGGEGYGAGGGSGGYFAGRYQVGGSGADGVVIVQYTPSATTTPVPVPASLPLLLGGLGLVGAVRRVSGRKAA